MKHQATTPEPIALIELTLTLKDDVSCQATTRKMQRDLFSCTDETMHASSSDGSLLAGFF